MTLDYLPGDPTLEPGEPWLLKKEPGESCNKDTLLCNRVRFCGQTKIHKESEKDVIPRSIWHSKDQVSVQAYDVTISGYNTFNTNVLRLWSALPICKDDDGDFDCFEAV